MNSGNDKEIDCHKELSPETVTQIIFGWPGFKNLLLPMCLAIPELPGWSNYYGTKVKIINANIMRFVTDVT